MERAGRDDAFATVAMLASVVAAGIAAVYWAARTGFENPVGPVVETAGLSLFIITQPVLSSLILRSGSRRYVWLRSYSFLWIAGILGVAILGWLVPVTGLNPLYLLGAAGLAGFAVATFRSFRSRPVIENLALLAGAAVFSTWTAGVVWGRIYKNPLFFENLAATGVVHHDALHLAAFANMLKTYGAASTGLDGLPYIPYHWGSPWLFAQWSNLLDMSVLDFYQLAFPVMMIPLLFASVHVLGAEIAFTRVPENAGAQLRPRWYWLVFLAATVGVIPIAGMDALGVWTSNPVISESYTVAVAVALLLAGCAVVFWRTAGAALKAGSPLAIPDTVFLVVVLPLSIAGLGYLKISLMVLAFCAAAYVALRARLYAHPAGIAAIALAAGLVALTYPMVSLPAHSEGIAPLDYIRTFVPRRWWVFFPLVHLFWTWLYVTLRLVRERVSTLDELFSVVRQRRLLDVEVMLVVAIAAVLPGLVLHIDGGSAFYFSDVQRWLAVALILSLPAMRARSGPTPATHVAGNRIGRIRLTRVAAILIAVPFAASMGLNTIHWTREFLEANAATRAALHAGRPDSSTAPRISELPSLASEATLRGGLAASRNYRVVNNLRLLSNLDLAERRRTALFIPQSERLYWEVLKRPGACSFSSFVAPSLAAMAMVDGMPPLGCQLSSFYGLGQYPKRVREQTPADTAVPLLCRKARRSGLARVMILAFDSTGVMTSSVADCAP